MANGMTGDAQSNIDVMENDIEKYCGRDDRENENIIDRTSEDVQKRKKYNLNVYEECSREEYEDSIRRLKDYITEGDVYVANMTRHIVVDSEKSLWTCSAICEFVIRRHLVDILIWEIIR